MKGDVLHDPVALVEDAEDRRALRHRCHSGRVRAQRHRRIFDDRLGRVFLGALAAASGSKNERDQERSGGAIHVYSGIHGS
jgi:hypothetical protein